jgi:hypothetical protein
MGVLEAKPMSALSVKTQPTSAYHWSLLTKRAATLSLWLLISLSLLFASFSNPAFGLQGDVPLHYHLTRAFARSLTEGVWLPRWAGVLDGGRGDAVFTFYGPLYYWLTGGLTLLFGVSLLTALQAVLLLSTFLAQANAYLLARQFWPRGPSLLAATLYVALPAYPLLAFNRAFLPNALALSFAPLVVLGAHLLLIGKTQRGLIIFTLAMSAVILTHAITTYLCALIIALMMLCYLPQSHWRGWLGLSAASLLTLALTAFFWVPQRVEFLWTAIGFALPHDYRSYFLFAPPADNTPYRQEWAALNQVASLITIAQTALALGLSLLCWRRLRANADAPLLRFCLLAALFGFFITLPVSDFLWRVLPGLRVMQFPWRFQAFVALACGLLAATAYQAFPALDRRFKMLVLAALTWIVIANLALTIAAAHARNRFAVTQPQTLAILDTSEMPVDFIAASTPELAAKIQATARSADQIYFRPRAAEQNYYLPTNEVGGLTILAGQGRVVAQQLLNQHREFVVEADAALHVRFETYYYPHWIARLDGRELAIEVEAESGLMLVDLPPGTHRLQLDYEIRDTAQRVARIVSICAWFCLGSWGAFALLAARRRR